MRVLVVSLMLAAALSLAGQAQAQNIPIVRGTMEFAPIGGASIPFGDFNLTAEPGFGLGATGSYYLMPNLALGASVVYNSYGLDSDPMDQASFSIWEFTAHGKYLLVPAPVTPYLKANAGMFRSSFSYDDGLGNTVDASSSDLGMGAGLGFQMRLPGSQFGLFGEGMAQWAFTEGSTTSYMTLRAGVNFVNVGR